MFRPLLRTLGLAAVAATLSSGAHADAPAADGFSAKATIVAKADATVLKVSVDVDPAYHWNKEYPAKFEVIGDLPAGVAFDKRIAKSNDGGITATGQQAIAELRFTRAAATKGPVTVQARFSICNDRVCLMKSAKLEVDVAGK